MSKVLSNKILTVSELTFAIKAHLEGKFNFISVKGEISNFKRQSSGHLYFVLKDKDAQLSAALFKANAKDLSKEPKDGDQVIAHGEISVYPPRGNYQIIVRELSYLGLGELLLKLHELKEELKAKGFFDKERKKPLPKLPKTIGVVTSPTGAVIQDIIKILKRRYNNFHLILNPVKVQGEGAAEEIAQAIYDFNKYQLADVLIVGRGGGSLEDLWAFNEKIVAQAIYDSKIPIISAVGHETDNSIADFVADLRAPTPSAAAEMVIAEKTQLINNLHSLDSQIRTALHSRIKQYKQNLSFILKQPQFTSFYILSPYWQEIDEMRSKIDFSIKNILTSKKALHLFYYKQIQSLNPKNQIGLLKKNLNNLELQINQAMKNRLLLLKQKFNKNILEKTLQKEIQDLVKIKKDNLFKLISHLRSLDPKNLLKKGYSILFSEKDSSIILSSKNVNKNDKVHAILHDGKIKLSVEDIYER